MTLARTLATARRVLQQLRHDPRTIALLILLPTVLMALLAWLLADRPDDFYQYGAPILGIFPLLVMFLVTSVATLRERTSGTMERLLAMPLGKGDFIFGYAIAFSIAAILQAVVVTGVSVGLLGLDVRGPLWALLLVAVLQGLLGTSLGLLCSAFARTEFQAVQFMPAVLMPQLLVCGLIIPRDDMPRALELVSNVLPMTYAVDATQQILMSTTVTTDFWRDIVVLVGFIVAGLLVASATLRRTTD